MDQPLQVAERQASAGTRDGVKGRPTCLAARAPLHAIVRLQQSRAIARLRPTQLFFLGTTELLLRKRAIRLRR